MTPPPLLQKIVLIVLSLALVAGGTPGLVAGQAPMSYKPAELDKLVSRIALYPDPLVAQILAGATYPDQIPDAARWADQHHYLTGQALADAIQGDDLPWDPSVQALLPFPCVLEMMASDMNWTTDLGNAFLAQQQDVMDAVQRERKRLSDYGYLRSNGQIIVGAGPYITIVPVNPGFIVVPYYDPGIVFLRAAARFLGWRRDPFGYGVTIGFVSGHGAGASTASTGVGTACSSTTPVGADVGNRAAYVHHFAPAYHPWTGVRGVERHELIPRVVRLSATRPGWVMCE